MVSGSAWKEIGRSRRRVWNAPSRSSSGRIQKSLDDSSISSTARTGTGCMRPPMLDPALCLQSTPARLSDAGPGGRKPRDRPCLPGLQHPLLPLYQQIHRYTEVGFTVSQSVNRPPGRLIYTGLVPEPERRLAAILNADVVGYSRLMAEDEEATVRLVTVYREQIELLVGQHRGRLADFTGDNFLAEFPTARDGVRCATEIQEVLKARNEHLPDDRKMQFRMGLHVGEVRVEGPRLFGTGVNVAARLQGLAEPGGLYISAAARDQLPGKLKLDCEDLGHQQFKNIPEPVRAYRVRVAPGPAPAETAPRPRRAAAGALALVVIAALGVGYWWVTRGKSPDVAAVRSGPPALAVLPFQELSGDPEQEYFADGISEDLTTRLSQVLRLGEGMAVGVPVVARNSTLVYQGRAVSVEEVGRELGVRYVVEGSVRRAAGRVRITAQLIDATTGHHVWAQTYDRDLTDLFAVQDEISQAVAGAVGVEVGRAETERAARASSTNLDAWDLAHKAAWHQQRMTKQDMATARPLLERAIELDPFWGWPIFALQGVHVSELANQWTDSPGRSAEAIVRLGRQAAAIDDRDPYGQLALGYAYGLGGEDEKALTTFTNVVEDHPNFALGHAFMALLFWEADPEAAVAFGERALELSPHSPYRHNLFGVLGGAHHIAGRPERALEYGRMLIAVHPQLAWGHSIMAASLSDLGRLPEARAAMAEALRIQPEMTVQTLFLGPGAERYIEALHAAGLPLE